MQITNRDVEIIRFINEFGFCEIKQIEKKFSIGNSRCYQIMQRLKIAGLVKHERIFHGSHGIFYLTAQGAEFTDLPPIRNIPKDCYSHQLMIINIYFRLTKQYPEATWVSERQLRHEKLKNRATRRNHVADGMLLFPDDKQIAIEVELTMKSKFRLERILNEYSSRMEINQIWYFCSPSVLPKVRKMTEKKSYIKTFSVE